MKSWLIASAGLALVAETAADGQRMVGHGPVSGGAMTMGGGAHWGGNPGMPANGGHWGNPGTPGNGAHWGNPGQPPRMQPGQPRWGSKVGGHWWGGVNAPGGWGAYHRPYRGWTLPSYWVAPRFYVGDWNDYGLYQPTTGYNWVRYYDDAVLVDGRGSVYDTVGGVDWDRYDNGYYTTDTQVYAGGGDAGNAGYYQDDGYAAAPGAGYAEPGYGQRVYKRPNNGIGGAVVGAVAGGVAGNLIAGRGNRLGGTLIGGGLGALAGQQIDRSVTADRRRRDGTTYAVEPGYGASYGEPPVARGYAPPPPVAYAPPAPVVQPLPPQGYDRYERQPGHWVSPNGSTVVTTSAGPYGASTTTVVVQTAPVITTTTTEIYEDSVTYTKRRPAKIKRVWRPKPVCRCY